MLDNNKLKIFDSDEVDTLDSLIEEKNDTRIKTLNKKEYQFEKIDLEKLSQELGHSANKNIPTPREVAKLYNNKNNGHTNSIIEPNELVNEIQSLTIRTEKTIEKLKSLHSTCSLGIVDLEHKIEFENLYGEEGQEILSILKSVSIYQRHIKDTLEKYKSISKLTQMLEKLSAETQIEKLDKVEEFQSSRVYTPRIFNIVEKKNYPTTKMSIQTIEDELNNLIEHTNKRYEKA